MFIVNGSNAEGVKTAQCATLEDALGVASDFMTSGMFNVAILDMQQKTYTESDIDLLVEVIKAEHRARTEPAAD